MCKRQALTCRGIKLVGLEVVDSFCSAGVRSHSSVLTNFCCVFLDGKQRPDGKLIVDRAVSKPRLNLPEK